MSTTMATTNPLAAMQPAGIATAGAKVKTFWESRTTSQRVYLGIGVAVTLLATAFFAHMVAAPDYKPLMSGMEPADAQTLGSQLAAKKIPYVVSPDGTSIGVPADQVDAARLELASHETPHSGRIGFEIFDKVSWGESEFDEKVNYQRALEGELERTIQTMSNVKSARVHLVMANESVFVDRERAAKASVTLRLRRGSLSKEEVAAITRLVAGAVDNLKPEDVALVDADSNKSLSVSEGTNASELEAEQELSRRLTATLVPIVGPEGVHATVNVDYDTSSSEQSQDKYDPAVSVALNMQKSEETATNGSDAAGIPGTSSNLPKPKQGTPDAATASPAAPGQSSKTESATYGVNRTTVHLLQPAGRIRRMTAAVLVDDAVDRHQEKGKWVETRHKRSADEMALIIELSKAAMGFDAARGDVMSVQNFAFHRPQESETPAPPTFAEKAQKNLRDYSAVIRYGSLLAGLLMVFLLVVRPMQKRALGVPDVVPAPLELASGAEEASLPLPEETLALRSAALKKQLTEFVRREPENSATAVRAWLREETL